MRRTKMDGHRIQQYWSHEMEAKELLIWRRWKVCRNITSGIFKTLFVFQAQSEKR